MRTWGFWTILAASCTAMMAPVASETRQKRIIHGVIIDQHNRLYDVTKWYVWIGDGQNCAGTGAWLHNCARPENVRCGGSLLTPDIVQTSCECLAAFIGPRQKNITTACVLGNWEKQRVIFTAVRDVAAMVDGYMSSSFYIHQMCGKLSSEPTYLTTHDYGFIKLRKKVKELRRDIAILFAPIYSIKNLGKLWAYNTNGGVVCMTVGYGSYEIDYNNMPETDKSASMRHAWVMLYDYLRCYYLLRVSKFKKTYLDLATWWCMTRIPDGANKMYLAPGDGGSPLSCNDQYSAIVSPHVHHMNSDLTLQYSSAIAFSPYQNAIEFRENFEKSIKLLVNDPTFAPTMVTIFPMGAKGYIKSGSQVSTATRMKPLLCISIIYGTTFLFI